VATGAKRAVYEVQYDAHKRNWRVIAEGSANASARADTKDAAIRRAVEFANAKPLGQVRVKRMDGTLQYERTYPRSSDPRRTRG
jgi:Uncharacterized protein conserved in bacteria (DUF2188)